MSYKPLRNIESDEERPLSSVIHTSFLSGIRKSKSEDIKKTSFLFPEEANRSNQSDNFYDRRRSVPLPSLQVSEYKFFELIELGDVEQVKEFLQEGSMFNINCKNFQGFTALHVALYAEQDKMIDFLLQQKRLDVTDCALHAILCDKPAIMVKILDRLKDISADLEFHGCVHSPDFSVNTTPLILAAQCDNFEIIEILLERGHFIPKPHPPCCMCEAECLRILQSEDRYLLLSAILDVYKALTSPAYICQTSDDPILTSFLLSCELYRCSQVYNIFKNEFLRLGKTVKMFATDLIACCRSCDEVEIVLSRREGSGLKSNTKFPRLILAMNLRQKEFVAHSTVQQVLEMTWLGDWYKWKCYPVPVKVFFILPRIIIIPFFVLACFFAPNSKFVHHYSLPVNRMINYISSYFIFLLILYIGSSQDKADQRKQIHLSAMEFPRLLFVASYIWSSTRMCFLQGYNQFFRFRWNIYEIVMEFIFVLHYMFLISAYIMVYKLPEEERQLERKYWHYLDPQLLAEVLFAVATIMAYFKLLLVIQIDENFGPLQVALGKMTVDCVKYMVFFFIIIMSFNVGLCRLYSYYNGMSQTDPDTQELTRQGAPFTNSLDTIKYLFWGLFALSEPDNVDVVIENIPGEGGKTMINQHYITEALGYYAFALYMVLTVIVVLNMMIGTMANTYQRVVNNVGVQWVYGKTEVYLNFISQSILPPPFNFLPLHVGFKDCREWIKKGPLTSVFQMKFSISSSNGMAFDQSEDEGTEEFRNLMIHLLQRYFRQIKGGVGSKRPLIKIVKKIH